MRTLSGFTVKFDTCEDKTVKMIRSELAQHPRKYSGVVIQTGVDISRFDGEGHKIKSGDVEVIYNDEPYALIEVKVGNDANSKNLINQMNKLMDAPHQFKALLVCGRFWKEYLIKNGWGYELDPNPPPRLLTFVAFCREWWEKGIWVYWVSDVRHLITKVFSFIYNPPTKDTVIIQEFVNKKFEGSDFCKKLQVVDGVAYDFAKAVSDKYETPFDFLNVDFDTTFAIINEVEIQRAKLKNREPRKLMALTHKIWDPYHKKG